MLLYYINFKYKNQLLFNDKCLDTARLGDGCGTIFAQFDQKPTVDHAYEDHNGFASK